MVVGGGFPDHFQSAFGSDILVLNTFPKWRAHSARVGFSFENGPEEPLARFALCRRVCLRLNQSVGFRRPALRRALAL